MKTMPTQMSDGLLQAVRQVPCDRCAIPTMDAAYVRLDTGERVPLCPVCCASLDAIGRCRYYASYSAHRMRWLDSFPEPPDGIICLPPLLEYKITCTERISRQATYYVTAHSEAEARRMFDDDPGEPCDTNYMDISDCDITRVECLGVKDDRDLPLPRIKWGHRQAPPATIPGMDWP